MSHKIYCSVLSALTLLLVIGTLWGCAPKPTPTPALAPTKAATKPPATATSVPPTPVPPTPVPEKVKIIFGCGGEAVELDPAEAIGGPAGWVIANLYDSLMEMTEDGEIVPCLATGWTVSDDDLTWTLTLREGVKFHDGTDFDATVVKFNIDRIMDPDLELANLGRWEPHIAAVNVVDKYTVQITTKEPYGGFLNLMAEGFSGLSSPDAIEKYGEGYSRHPVATGPFMFDSWVPGERIVLVKNPNYWREGPFIDELEFRVIPEGSVRVLALEGGDVDVIDQLPAQDLEMIEKNPQLGVIQKTLYRLYYWAFNLTKDVWKDPKIRIALNHAIDRESIVRNIALGAGEAANSFVSPSLDGSIPIDVYDYDPEKARRMLEEAGYPFDYEAVCYATEGRYFMDRQVAEALQGMLAEVGVKVNVQILEWGAFVDAIWFTPADDPVAQTRDWMQTTWGAADLGYSWRATLHGEMWPPDGYNEPFYSNPEVDRLIDEINRTTDLEKRRVLIEDVQRELIKDPPYIISHFEQAVIAHQAKVRDLEVTPEGTVRFRRAKVVE